MILYDYYPQFFTATNLNWLPILQYDTCKQIIIDGLTFRVKSNQVTVYAYVIMPNPMHLIWQIHDGIKRKDFQRDFLKFTAKHILNWLSENDKLLHSQLQVNDKDRKYQVWERNSLSIDIYNAPVLVQKMKYLHTIHYNLSGNCVAHLLNIDIAVQNSMRTDLMNLDFCNIIKRSYCCWSGDQQRQQQVTVTYGLCCPVDYQTPIHF